MVSNFSLLNCLLLSLFIFSCKHKSEKSFDADFESRISNRYKTVVADLNNGKVCTSKETLDSIKLILADYQSLTSLKEEIDVLLEFTDNYLANGGACIIADTTRYTITAAPIDLNTPKDSGSVSEHIIDEPSDWGTLLIPQKKP